MHALNQRRACKYTGTPVLKAHNYTSSDTGITGMYLKTHIRDKWVCATETNVLSLSR